MRILNVGDFNWMTGRESDTSNIDLFAIRSKLTNAAIRAGHCVIEFSDRAVSRTATPFRSRRLGKGAANRAFLRVVDEARPDLVLLHNADELTNDAMAECRRLSKGVTIVEIGIDPLPDPKARARLLRRRDVVDAGFVTTAGEGLAEFAGRRGFFAFMPNPVDRAIETERAFEQADPKFDLILPANDRGLRRIGGRSIAPSVGLDAIRNAVPDLRLAAPGLDGPRLRGARYIEALASARMGWAFSRFNEQPLYASDRMAHMLGNGLLTCLDAATGFDRFYRSDEVVFYRDLDDLIAQLLRIGDDASGMREAARRGWERTWRLFEVERVFGYLLEQLYRDGGASNYEWPCRRWRGT